MKSPSHRNRASCSGKEQFDTYALAEKAARRRRNHHCAMTVYHCRTCGAFHVGNRSEPKSSNRRPRKY